MPAGYAAGVAITMRRGVENVTLGIDSTSLASRATLNANGIEVPFALSYAR
jgi:hypothetical protein